MRDALVARGHRVSILAGYLSVDCTETPAYAVPALPMFERVIARIRGSLLGEEFEVFHYWKSIVRGLTEIHAHDPVDFLEIEESYGWGAHIQSKTDVPVVVRLHGPAVFTVVGTDKDSPRNRRRVVAEGLQLETARLVLSPSAATLNALREYYRLPVEQARIVANPLVMDPSVSTWQSDSCDPDTVLFVGRFDYGKGADLALAAFERLAQARPSARLLFVGPDDGLVGANGVRLTFVEYCAAMLKPSTLAAIEFFGSQPRTRIEDLRRRAGVTIISSRWENQPYVLMEAMWQGCPIVANCVGGMPELIEHGATGLLADGSNAADFAEAISVLLQDKGLAARLGAAARRSVHERHSAAVVSAAALEAYGSLAGADVCEARMTKQSQRERVAQDSADQEQP